MNYPVLHTAFWGGGLLIALVATIHVFIAHFAVGGGLFIAVMETRMQRTGEVGYKDYLYRYAKFFLILTMVAGGLTGVGIWASIGIGAPGATSILIHTFAMGWATEWTFFLGEIVVLLVYMKYFHTLSAAHRLALAWLYFAFAWGSLVTVQGFISFMLTPGDWLATKRFVDGFFNPTFLPGVVLRMAIATVIAGAFALWTSLGVTDAALQKRLVRFCAWWSVIPLPVAVLAGWWHIQALSPEQQALALGRSPEVAMAMRVFWWVLPAILALCAALAAGLSRAAARVAAMALLVTCFLFIGSFEWMRESARRPYLITGHIYSNGILVEQAPAINAKGALPLARWSSVKAVTPENKLEAGRQLYMLECISCHSIGGPMLDILPRSAKYSTYGMDALLSGLGKVAKYMPPFLGTKAERQALAAYVTEGLHGTKPDAPVDIASADVAIPPFDDAADTHLLTVTPSLGVNLTTDCDSQWTMGLGLQTLTAQLVARDAAPRLVTQGVTLSYAIDGGPKGMFEADPANKGFRAANIKPSPYAPDGSFAPYPLATVQAVDNATGRILAKTQVVLPVSTELGCKNCHGGPWKHKVAGIAGQTAADVLKAHDRLSLTALAGASAPADCRSCHDDKATGANRSLNLSAAMHGLHAVYLSGRGADACNACHPTSPTGATRGLRDPHHAAGLDCTNCHGPIEDHALSLIKREAAQGVAAAKPLMALLTPREADPAPRAPWVNQPRCVSCHTNYGPPENTQATGAPTADAKDLFKNKRDDLDAMGCAACHGSVHAVYPAKNPYGPNRDVIQPLQYQKLAAPLGAKKNCKACHTVDMDSPAHHPGMGVE